MYQPPGVCPLGVSFSPLAQTLFKMGTAVANSDTDSAYELVGDLLKMLASEMDIHEAMSNDDTRFRSMFDPRIKVQFYTEVSESGNVLLSGFQLPWFVDLVVSEKTVDANGLPDTEHRRPEPWDYHNRVGERKIYDRPAIKIVPRQEKKDEHPVSD